MCRTTPAVIVIALVLVAAVSPGAARAADESGVPHAWVGVMMGGDAGDAATRPGVGVRYVIMDSPAHKAGLRARDRIVAVDGATVGSSSELLSRLRDLDPGAWVNLTVERGDRELLLDVRLSERPGSLGEMKVRRGWAGLRAIDLPPALREHFGAPPEAGVMIAEVVPGSPAEAAGLELGDVVYEVDGEPLPTTRELRNVLAGGGVGNTLEFTAARNGAELRLDLLLADAPDINDGNDVPVAVERRSGRSRD